MKTLTAVVVALLLLGATARAQVVTGPGSKFAFDIVAPGTTATDLVAAMTIKAYITPQGGTVQPARTLTGLACVASATVGTYNCTTPLPALAPGAYSATVTATVASVESAPSNAVGYSYVVISISNLRVQ